MSKLIVISAPSGAGKTSIVHHVLDKMDNLCFSISACSRKMRKNEINGEDYYFLDVKEFEKRIQENDFLEWQEVYPKKYYGTLNSEVKRIFNLGKHIIFDIDVLGALNIKKMYDEKCLAIFIMPPTLEILQDRLKNRGTETHSSIRTRVEKAEIEILKSKDFDKIIMNDNFEIACKQVIDEIKIFISEK